MQERIRCLARHVRRLAVRAASHVDDDFSLRVAIAESVVGALDGSEGEAPRVNQWKE
jgi:hypothetical protein